MLLTPIPRSGMPGDANCDNHINIDDLVIVITHWGASGGATIADLNADGTVNIDDLMMVITHWG